MKKLLELLGTVNLTAITMSSVIACDFNGEEIELISDDSQVTPSKVKSQNTSSSQDQKLIKFQSKIINTQPIIQTKNPEVQNNQPTQAPTPKITNTHPIIQSIIQTNNSEVQNSQPTQPIVNKPANPSIKTKIDKVDAVGQPSNELEVNTLWNNVAKYEANSHTKVFNEKNIVPISFFKDLYDNVYFIADDGLYVLKNKTMQPIKINNIFNSNIYHVTFDRQNNIYFASYSVSYGAEDEGELYILKNNSTNAIKINNVNRKIFNITIDNYDNLYLDTNNGLHILKKMQNKNELEYQFEKCSFFKENSNATRQYLFYEKTIHIDENNNLYFSISNATIIDNQHQSATYVLKAGQTEATRVNNLNGKINASLFNPQNNNLYFATRNGLYYLKGNSTDAIKINKLDEVLGANKANYIFIDNNLIYIGCLHFTFILDFDHNVIKTLSFDSHHFQFDNQDNIYFASGRGLYKYSLSAKESKKIKIKTNGQMVETDEGVTNIYFVNNKIYFRETTRTNKDGENFYQIISDDIAEKINRSDVLN